jgi:hypothetical protein
MLVTVQRKLADSTTSLRSAIFADTARQQPTAIGSRAFGNGL